MELSPIGIVADIFWHEIRKHADFVKLGEFVVMPNHIHGILIVDKPDDDGTAAAVTTNAAAAVETRHALSLQRQYKYQRQPQSNPPPQTCGQKRFQNQGKNTISSIICGYKSAVTNHAHRLGYDFRWQPRFHDHIIKNNDEYQRIAEYIINNPVNWKNDKFYINFLSSPHGRKQSSRKVYLLHAQGVQKISAR
jgi:REP element-mobilizing transposase RayT